MAKKCQVCDGPIENGRCKLCGMIYRRDEELYHLNESRKVHYQHASERARWIMRQQESALPDRRREELNRDHPEAERSLADLLKSQAQNRKKKPDHIHEEQKNRLQPKPMETRPGTAGTANKTMDSLRFMKTAAQSAAAKSVQTGYNRTVQKAKRNTFDKNGEPRTKRIIIVAMVICILVAVIESISTYRNPFTSIFEGNHFTWEDVNEAEKSVEAEWYDEEEYKTLEEALDETEENEFLHSFYMVPEDAKDLIRNMSPIGDLQSQDSITGLPGGYYMAVLENGFGTLHISGQYGAENNSLSRYNNYLVFELAEEETLEIKDPKSANVFIALYYLTEF